MNVREVGDLSASYARDDAATRAEIVRVTSLPAAVVRRKLEGVHGRTLVRGVFAREWPSDLDELGLTCARDASLRAFIAKVAEATGLTSGTVAARLRSAAPDALVRDIFAKEWLNRDAASPSDVGTLSVAEAESLGFVARIAHIAGIDAKSVRRRIGAAHGKALVRTIFAKEWPISTPRSGEQPTPVRPREATPTPPRGAPAAGERVSGRYELIRLLGQGGFGQAWEARDSMPAGTPLRVLKFPHAADPEAEASLRREMERAFDLTHPHICKLCDIQTSPERGVFLVFAHGGESLAVRLEPGKPLPVEMALRITRHVASALDYAHEQDVIHQDVSPGNILIDGKNVVRLTDFGVAKRAIALTTTGGNKTMVGTSTAVAFNPRYVAPELLTRGEARRTSDQYSLALVLCSMLEGRVFKTHYAPRPFPELSAAQNAALQRGLKLDPENRFESCGAFANAVTST